MLYLEIEASPSKMSNRKVALRVELHMKMYEISNLGWGILHILLEFSYPPFQGASSSTSTAENELPKPWENLPFLALPDQSHTATNGG